MNLPRLVFATSLAIALSGFASFDSATTTLSAASLDAHDPLTTQVRNNVDAGRRAMIAAEAQARLLDAGRRAQFEAAARTVATAERRLQHSILAAQSAPSSEWARAREALAADYDSYIQAVAHAQRVAAAGPRATAHPSADDGRSVRKR